MSLWEEFLNNDGPTIHKWTHYFPAYERHLSRFRDRSVTMVEIGCGAGGSVRMWKRWLGPAAQIVGIDIRPECKRYEEPQIAVRIGDQGDPEFLAGVVEEFGPIDIVLDDGSHRMEHLVASFRALYPHLDRNGVYMAEDLQTAYSGRFGGGYKREGSFLELFKDLIDELHADHAGPAVEATEFSRSTLSMHVYDGLVAFERGRLVDKRTEIIGGTAADRRRRRVEQPAPEREAPVPDAPEREAPEGNEAPVSRP